MIARSLLTTERETCLDAGAVGLTYAVDGPVATVALDRPEVRNAQTPAMWRALARDGPRDPRRGAGGRRGAGERPPFSAGLDRAMLDPHAARSRARRRWPALLALSDVEASRRPIDEYQQGFTWLRDPRFVSVAAVQGYAIGAGFQLALSCDLRVLPRTRSCA